MRILTVNFKISILLASLMPLFVLGASTPARAQSAHATMTKIPILKSPFTAKHKVMKMPPHDTYSYCWVDNSTVLLTKDYGTDHWRCVTVPSKPKYAKLCKEIRAPFPKGDWYPELYNASPKYVEARTFRHNWILSPNGDRGPDLYGYHSYMGWRADGRKAIRAEWNSATSFIHYCDVKLYTYGSSKSISEVRVANNPKQELFVFQAALACCIDQQYISVLSEPIIRERPDQDYDRVWLLKRRLRDLNGPTLKIEIALPEKGQCYGSISPDCKRFLLWFIPKHSTVSTFYVGRVEDGKLSLQIKCPTDIQLQGEVDLKWKPGSNSISLVWNGYLYAFPVD